MKPRAFLAPVLAVAVLIAVGAFSYSFYQKRRLERVQLDLTTLVKVGRGSLENKFEEVGEIAPVKQVNVGSNASGRVAELDVKEGETVKRGQKLAVIQPGKSASDRYVAVPLYSPADGVVLRPTEDSERGQPTVKKFIVLDDYVTGRFDDAKSPTALMAIGDLSRLVVKLTINEIDVLKFHEGMPVTVTVDALPGQEFEGTVTTISRQAEESSRGGGGNGKVFRTEVTLKRKDDRLRIGTTARVAAILDKKDAALKMSLSGLFEDDGRSLAYLYVPGALPREVAVKTGFRTPLEVEILDGLKEGDQVFGEKPLEFEALAKTAAPSVPSPAAAKGG